MKLDVTFDLPSARLRTIRHYTATSGSPTFETWTTFSPLGSSVTVSDLNAFALTIPVGTIHWVNGLQGDSVEAAHDSAFTLEQRTLQSGERLTLGAIGRASEQTVPWFAVDSGPDVFYARFAVVRRLVAGRRENRRRPRLAAWPANDVDQRLIDGRWSPCLLRRHARQPRKRLCRASDLRPPRPARRPTARTAGHLQHVVRVRRRD